MTTLGFDAAVLPRLTRRERIRETARLARIILRTGDNVIARAYTDGMRIGFAGGTSAFRVALGSTGTDGSSR